jgi:hypothetical protein
VIVLKIFAALFLALIATLGGYYVYADHRAEGAANQFCNAVVMGSAASSIAEKVQAAGGRYLSSSNSNLYKVFFQGPPIQWFLLRFDGERREGGIPAGNQGARLMLPRYSPGAGAVDSTNPVIPTGSKGFVAV